MINFLKISIILSILLISNFVNAQKIALVIGNGNYQNATKLQNALNDADLMQETLEKLNFTVYKFKDLTLSDMHKQVDIFYNNITSNDTVLFYYAGHGIQSDGINYLVPINAFIQTNEQIKDECMRIDYMFQNIHKAGVNIIILDACRDNKFRGFKKVTDTIHKGLAFIEAPSNTLIAYATAPGQPSFDGYGNNGLYTEILAKEMLIPNRTINEILQITRVKVKKIKNNQTPWENSSLEDNFYFIKDKNFIPDNNNINTNSVFIQNNETIFNKKTDFLQRELIKSLEKNEYSINENADKSNFAITINAKVNKKKENNDYGNKIYYIWLEIIVKIKNYKTGKTKTLYYDDENNLKGSSLTSFDEAAEKAYKQMREKVTKDIINIITNN